MDANEKAAMQARAFVEQGRMQRNGGDLTAALSSYQKAAALWRWVQPARLPHTLRHVADIAREAAQLQVAEDAIAETLRMYRAEPPDGLEMANTLRVAALIAEEQKRLAEARALWQEAVPLYKTAGVQAGIDESVRRLGKLGAG